MDTAMQESSQSKKELDRRTALGLAAAATAGVVGIAGLAGRSDAQEHEHHQHHGAEGNAASSDASAASKHQAIIEAALLCVKRGEACIPHCIDLMAKGDSSLKDCIRSVSAMLPMCEALTRFAALDAPRLKELAKLCGQVCEDCQKECKKHAPHHEVCRQCAESCEACAKECKKLTEA